MFKNKRGISPLVATALLIIFAVSLGSITMAWGRGYIEEKGDVNIEGIPKTSLEADNTVKDINLTKLGIVEYNIIEGKVELVLHYKIDVDTKKIKVRVVGTEGTKIVELEEQGFSIDKPLKLEVPYDGEMGEIKDVSLIE